jgi:hypothetical protein
VKGAIEMTRETAIKLFESKKVRSVWDAEKGNWYFAIIDVVSILTESADPGAYWRKLKERLKNEGNETVTNCHGLKMTAVDGKQRLLQPLELFVFRWRHAPSTGAGLFSQRLP